jgi:hypothetical protein
MVGTNINDSNMTQLNLKIRAIMWGALGTSLLLTVFFSVVSLISGWDFAQDQFSEFWFYILPLALGFGAQVGLYEFYQIYEKYEEIIKRMATKL